MAERARKHVTGVGYVLTYVSLILLAAASFVLSRAHLAEAGLPIALGIALGKALLVVFFFMHLIEQRLTTRLVMLMSVLFVALLVSLTVADVASRRPEPIPPRPLAPERQPRPS